MNLKFFAYFNYINCLYYSLFEIKKDENILLINKNRIDEINNFIYSSDMDIVKYIKPKNYIAESKNTRQLFLVVGALLTNLLTYSLFKGKMFKDICQNKELEKLKDNEKHEFKLYHDSLYYIIGGFIIPLLFIIQDFFNWEKFFFEIRKENVIFEILLSTVIFISSIGLFMILMVHGTNFFEIIKKKTVNLHDVFQFFFNILFGSIISLLIVVLGKLYDTGKLKQKYINSKIILKNNRIEDNKYYNNVETRETLNYLFS
jgi:hypothetical protein